MDKLQLCQLSDSLRRPPEREVRIYRADAVLGSSWGLAGTIRPTTPLGSEPRLRRSAPLFGRSIKMLDDGSVAVTQNIECAAREDIGLFIFDREDIEPVPGVAIPGVATPSPLAPLCGLTGAPCHFINPILMGRDRITLTTEPKSYSIDPLFWNCEVKWQCGDCVGRLCTGEYRFEFALKKAGLDLGEVELFLMSAKGEVLGEAYETDSGLAVNLSVSDPFEVPSFDELGFVFHFGDVPEGKAFDVPATMWSSNQENQ